MGKKLCVLLFSLAAWQLAAQMPSNVVGEGRLRAVAPLSRLACTSKAGTISLGPLQGQSNTPTSTKVIFLCFQDSFRITHNGDFDLSGDPVPATPAGIGYAFYNCAPDTSRPGPSLQDILGDSCLNRSSILVNGVTTPPALGFWIARGDRLGNITFSNRGGLQNAYNGGKPISFFFAPITIDRFNNPANLPAYEEATAGAGVGRCVNVNPDQAFQVVYLNPIATDLRPERDANGCQGRFVLRGGLPEFDSTSRYQVTITLASDSTVRGVVTSGNLGHEDTVRFFVPQPGDYNIVVEDGKSCGANFSVNMAGCSATTFELPFRNARPGDDLCVDLTVQDFNRISALELGVTWDESVVEYTGIQRINPGMSGLNTNLFGLNGGRDTLRLAWTDPAFLGVTLPDSATLFQICFRVIGRLGQNSPLRFLPPRRPNETVGDPNTVPFGYIFRNGQINLADAVLFVGVTTDSVRCNGESNGAITVTAANATPPYQVTWRALSPLPTASGFGDILASGGSFRVGNLPAGNYAIRVQDASTPLNVFTDTVVIIQPASNTLRLIVDQDPSCFGASDGSLRAEILTNGVVVGSLDTNRLKLVWSIPGQRGQTRITGLEAGAYSATLTDAAGCSSQASTNIANPSEVAISPTVVQPACSGLANGQITLRASGGTSANGRYRFRWANGLDTSATTSSLRNLLPGTYCVTITDDRDCSIERCFQLEAIKTLSIDPAVVNPTCFGGRNGEIIAAGNTDGAPPLLPYTFNWQNTLPTPPVATPTNSTIRNLPAGTYVVTMRDNDPRGCRTTDTIVVTQPTILRPLVVERRDESCAVGGDGLIRVSVSGGTLPYTFNWSNGSRDSVISNLRQGNYTLSITDRNGCDTILNLQVTTPASPIIDQLRPDTLNCPSDRNGTLTVTATPNGSPIATISWSNGSTGSTIIGLAPGQYVVTVTAQDGCRTSDTTQVIAPTAVRIDSVLSTSPVCPTERNGQLRVVASGGTMPYRYVWPGNPRADTSFLATRIGLAAGSYAVTVVDANNCPPATQTAVVSDPPSIVVTFLDSTAIRCVGECNGAATASARFSDGRSGRFTFSWPSGESNANVATSRAVQLCGKFQTVTVQDSNACAIAARVSIPSPDSIFINAQPTDVSCNGRNDGRVAAQVRGGTAPYTYLWIGNGATTDTVGNLTAGSYRVRVTDFRGCTAEQSVDLTEPDSLILSINQAFTRNATCSNTTDGRIAVQVNTQDRINGLGPAPYTWSNNISTPISPFAENLAPGTYFVTVTDLRGCTDSASYTVLSPPPVVAVIPPPAEPKCFGEATQLRIDTVFGGNGRTLADYTITVNNNGLNEPVTRAVPIFAGVVVVRVEDQAKCAFLDTLQVNQPLQLLAEFVPDVVVVELGDSTTTLNPIITASLPVTSFTYSPPRFLSDPNSRNPVVQPEDDQEYVLTVVDTNGCTTQAKVFVELDRNRNVYLPNAFSPNGDGSNDEFRVFACRGVRQVTLVRIFDRWGNLVFDRGVANPLAPNCDGGIVVWDGLQQDGKGVNEGVYVYVVEVEFLDNVKLLYRGNITLVK